MIHYVLYKNYVTPDPNDYAATVKTSNSADIDALAERMVNQGSTITRTDIVAVLEDAIKATESYLLEGWRVNFGGLVELFPRIKGKFFGLSDGFDAARHSIDVGANPGSRVRKTVRNSGTVIKDETQVPSPNAVDFIDTGSVSANQLITPGNIGEIVGKRLKFDPTQADEGAFLIPASGGSEIKIPVTEFKQNSPSSLIFLIPTLPPGTYKVEVRSRVNGGTELRVGVLEAQLQTV